MDPSSLATCVQVNKNKAICDPDPKTTYKAYRSKFGTVKGEDKVEPVSGSEHGGSDGDTDNDEDGDDDSDDNTDL